MMIVMQAEDTAVNAGVWRNQVNKYLLADCSVDSHSVLSNK